MKITKEEQAAVLALRKQKEADKKKNTPIKIGYLKHNIYYFSQDFEEPYWLASQNEKDSAVKDFRNSFKLIAKKGTKCVCRKYDGVSDDWSIEAFDEVLDSKWAEENLENIQPYIKSNK